MSLDSITLKNKINELVDTVNNLSYHQFKIEDYLNVLEIQDTLYSINEHIGVLKTNVVDISESINIKDNHINTDDIKLNNVTIQTNDRLYVNNMPIKNEYNMALPKFTEYTNEELIDGEYYILLHKDNDQKIPATFIYKGKDLKYQLFEVKDNKIVSDYQATVYRRAS